MPAKSLKPCLTLCDPLDCSLPGSFVHEILQARILEWNALLFSRENHRDGKQIGQDYIEDDERGKNVMYGLGSMKRKRIREPQ